MIIFGKEYGDPVMQDLARYHKEESQWDAYCESLHEDEEPTYEGFEEWKQDRRETMADMVREAMRDGI